MLEHTEHTADGSSWASETDGEDPAGSGRLLVPQVASGISSSSCDVNGFDYLGQAHTIPRQDCASHSKGLWSNKLILGSGG